MMMLCPWWLPVGTPWHEVYCGGTRNNRKLNGRERHIDWIIDDHGQRDKEKTKRRQTWNNVELTFWLWVDPNGKELERVSRSSSELGKSLNKKVGHR